ncbi:MAG TPA: FG-GAP-like repeat-containing protein [Thermoanaerobaculia bacterium]|nr:FG-GAP-like repeat-containing protein [Thermoanaerobaculia bacterium]
MAVLLFAGDALPQQLRLVPLRRVGVIADYVGAANFAVADLDGDGTNDVVSCSQGSPFAVTRTGASTWSTSWMGPDVGCTSVAVGDRDGDGGLDVLVTTSDSPGKLLALDPRSLGGPAASVTLPGTAAGASIAIGNIDIEPAVEIVVVTSTDTYVYDGATLALEWTGQGFGGSKVALGDVDGDHRPDVVINGSTGWILDGEARTSKMGYLGGFGYAMAVGDVDADGKDEIVFSGSWSQQVTILNADTMQTTSIPATDSPYPEAITIADANDDNAVEIITGNNQWGSIEGRRPSDGLKLWSINNPEHGVQGLAAGDVTGDGKAEVIWGAGYSSSGQDVLFIGNAVTKTITWQSLDLDGTFASAVGDLDGDGRAELVVASGGSRSGYSGSVIEIFDAATGVSKGTLSPDPYYDFHVTRLAIGQADADPAREIIALGSQSYDPRVISWDGVTRAREFTSASAGCCSSPSLLQSMLTVTNIDGDSVDEIILGQSDSKVIVLNGASNVIQRAVTVSGSVVDTAVADLNGDSVPDLVVTTSTGVYAYDTGTWAALGQVALSSATKMAAGAGFVAITTYDGSVRTFAGAALTAGWTCTSSNLGTTATAISSLTFGTIGGTTRLLLGDESGNVRMLSPSGATCPSYTVSAVAKHSIARLALADATGDGRPELLVDSWFGSEIDLLGLSTDTPGDADGNGVVDAADLAAIIDFRMSRAPGLAPAADANGDKRVGVEDVFQLINYKFAGGPAPTP